MSSYLHDKNHECQQETPLHKAQTPVVKRPQKVNSPVLRLLANEIAHQLLALLALHIDDLNAARLEVRLATEESLVLAEDNAGDLVEDAGAGAHVAGREGGVHGGTLVG